MRKFIYFVLPLLLIACNNEPKEDGKTVKNLKEYSINQFMDNESVNGGSFSSDKSKLLVTSNRTGGLQYVHCFNKNRRIYSRI